VLVQYMTGNGNDQSERVVEVARFLSPLSAAAERFVVSSFVRSFIRSSLWMRDCERNAKWNGSSPA